LETVPRAKFEDLEAKLADSIPKREAEIKTRALEARISELQARIVELEARLAESMPKAQELKSKVNATVLKVKPEAKTELEIEIPSKVVAPASFVTETPLARTTVEPSKVLPSRPTIAEGQEYEVTIQGISKRGDGIAKIGDFTVFVPRSEVGSRLKIKIIRVDRYARYATAGKAE
jgi:predicted RNA-binding protein with TRAM domain